MHGMMKKCLLGVDCVTFYGYEIRPGSWALSQKRKDSIRSLLFPITQKMMQSFLGCAYFTELMIK